MESTTPGASDFLPGEPRRGSPHPFQPSATPAARSLRGHLRRPGGPEARVRSLRRRADARHAQPPSHPTPTNPTAKPHRSLRPRDQDRDRRAVQHDLQTGAGDAVRHRNSHTTGYGSSARWARDVQEPGRTLGVPDAARAAAGTVDRRRPGRLPSVSTCKASSGWGRRPAATHRRTWTPTVARSTTPAPSRRCARTTGRARPSTWSTTTRIGTPAAGIECPVLVQWAGRGSLPRFCPDVLDAWRPQAGDVRGSAIDAKHFLAEDRPEETADQLLALPTS